MQNKPVFGVFDKARLKPVSLATESLDRILSNERKTNALIRLRGCTGWYVPLLFTSPEDKYTGVILVPSVNVSGCSFGHGVYRYTLLKRYGKSPNFASRDSTVSLYPITETYHANPPIK